MLTGQPGEPSMLPFALIFLPNIYLYFDFPKSTVTNRSRNSTTLNRPRPSQGNTVHFIFLHLARRFDYSATLIADNLTDKIVAAKFTKFDNFL